MISDDMNSLSEYSELTGPKYMSLPAKADAWDIHEFRGTPTTLRPKISLDELAHIRNLAHNYILAALHYLAGTDETLTNYTDEGLQNAAQLLEKLYLNRPSNYPDRNEELYTAALAYYLSGHYAQAFVIMRGLSLLEDSTNLMQFMFLRELPKIRLNTLQLLSNKHFIDTFLMRAVKSGEMDEDEVIDSALKATLNRIYILFHEYARTGREGLIEQALSLSNVMVVGLVKTEIDQNEDRTQQLREEILTVHYNTPKRAFDSLKTGDTVHNCNDESSL